jgi:hypothetical protein
MAAAHHGEPMARFRFHRKRMPLTVIENCNDILLSSNRYRDPNCSKTAEVFQSCAEWAADGRFTDEDVSQVTQLLVLLHRVWCCLFTNPLLRPNFPCSPPSMHPSRLHPAASACSPTASLTNQDSFFATVRALQAQLLPESPVNCPQVSLQLSTATLPPRAHSFCTAALYVLQGQRNGASALCGIVLRFE